MAAVLETKDPAAKLGSQVDEQLAQATSRIRAHDLTFGGLVLLALVLLYATTMISLDKALTLPEWVRQMSLGGFVLVLLGSAYLTLLSPLRKRINPLYAAKQVERTIEDPKNSVTGYVDAVERGNLNPTVKAALARQAAKASAEADVNRAVDHRSLVVLGGVAIVLLLTLGVLFFLFRPAQFGSLVGRAFVPFSSDPIATQTQLTLMKPDPAEPTITTGQSITVAVHVGGKVPSPDNPDRVRLLIRHNLADPNYDELPMIQGENSRDWEVRVPDYMVQNGFWYKVAAGDTVTPEYKVTVRSLPMFTDFTATYEYPKYLPRNPETAHDPVLRGYRGTTVTLFARTNREVRDGRMEIKPSKQVVLGTPVPGKPDSLQFQFKLIESGKYELTFNAANGEQSADAFQSTITVDADLAPKVMIDKPEEDTVIDIPANGQIVVDGKVGDEFGIDTVTLKMRIAGKTDQLLLNKPYIPDPKKPENKSLRRQKDGTWPTDFAYKGSIDLSTLTKDATGAPLALTTGMELEFWLEATDNCTEPKPNVGTSKIKRVRLVSPKVDEMEKQDLNAQKEARKKEEQEHNAQQQDKLNTEERKPQNAEPQPKNNDPNNQPKTEPKPGDLKTDPKKPQDPKPGDKNGMGNTGGMGMTDPKNPPEKKPNDPPQPMDPGMGGMGGMGGTEKPPEAPMPKPKDQANLDKTADELQNELDKENKNGGAAKPNPNPNDTERTPPGEQKPQPMGGTPNDASTQKPPEPKQPNPMDPMNAGNSGAGASKPEGNLEKPSDPAAPKPEPKQGDGMNPKGTPSEKRDEPFGAPPGTEKPEPKDQQPGPTNPNQKQDPKSGATGKPPAKPDGDPNAGGNTNPKDPQKDPTEGAASTKPAPEMNRGGEKEPPKSAGNNTKPTDNQTAGGAKPEKTPPAAGTKPPPDDKMGMGMNPPAETKPTDGANNPMNPKGPGAAETKPDQKQPMGMGGTPPMDRGTDKGQPDEKGTQNAGGGPKEPKKDKIDPKELADAAKDLTDPDPKKRQAAEQKLDKAIGEEKRKEIQQLAQDLKSDDPNKRAAAEKKLKDMVDKANQTATPEPKKEQPKLTKEQMKEFADAAKDLTSKDPQKKAEAQKKLDKMIGEDNRKELEQVLNDLQSDDPEKRAAAQKKIEDWKKQAEELAKKDGKQDGPKDGKGKELTPQQMAELLKKAQDLNSKDDAKRKQAEKDIDKMLGEDQRKQLQEAMKNHKPGNPEDEKKLKELMEQIAKNNPPKTTEPPKDWREGLGTSPPAKGQMEEDLKNRLLAAERQLDVFEKNRYNKALQAQKGWTQEDYDKFLEGYRKRVEDMRKEYEQALNAPPSTNPTDPKTTLTAPGSGKVEGKIGDGSGSTSTRPVPPPGFEGAQDKFKDALKKKP
ncbi:MAG: hypothetical protein L0241_24910 [Planctomycetia bacterium]|nr:hypothetical protein [Planctomycetia bacterium]